MKSTIIQGKMNELSNQDGERDSLIDYVRYRGSGLAENLSYVVGMLHSDIRLFKRMIDHARNLPNSHSNNQYNIENLVGQLNDRELPVVKGYLFVLGAYLTGQPFKPVDEAANKLLNLIPIPDTIIAPEGTFSEEEIEAREKA
jgi:hypothetical protein